MKKNLKTYLLIISLISFTVYSANAAMSLSFTHKDQTYCGDLGCATVTVTGNIGTLSYQWYDPGAWPFGPNYYTVCSLTGGTYTVVVTDGGNGSTASGTVTIGFFDGFPPEFSGPTSDCNPTPYIYTITNVGLFPPNTVFEWFISSIGSVGYGTSKSLSPTSPNTIWVVASDNLCSTQSIVLTIQKCCNPNANYVYANDIKLSDFMFNVTGSYTTSYYSGTSYPQNIVINGTLTWDMDATFAQCHFHCGDGSRILDKDGKQMGFKTCTFKAGCGVMWQGIEITSTNTGFSPLLYMTSTCDVQDAYYGIWERNPCDIQLDNCNFDNNYIGVKYGFFGYIPNTGWPLISNQPGLYNHVQFHATHPLIPAYPGLIPDPT
ncbi:MAG: hypothetical protein ABI855_15365, partial [Bacteroidota bacterium]